MLALQIRNLRKSYGSHTVFRELSLKHDGGTLGIAGLNGSGKSTLLRCIGGLLKPDDGDLGWLRDGTPLGDNEVKRMLGYAAPYISLYGELSPRENLSFILRLRKERPDDRRTDALLEWVGLASHVDRPFGKLSTGQKQRARLASALVHDPDILLLDEPGSNLDEEGQRLVAQIAARFRSSGHMLVIASNNSDELDLCERVFSVAKH
ncbi:MAG: ABC transporter ATP-binding protein [Balneolaceae bacterium]|nr:ABC transporter ATP-binding protein [Balneolaceae bacterium]